MIYPKVLYCFPDEAGEPFMPSNGTDGCTFTEAFCDNCLYQYPEPDRKPQCFDILMQTLVGIQPKEWIFSSEGWPICTAWKKWDWGNGDDDGWNEPPTPEPKNPRQLVMPFDLIGVLVGYDDFLVMPIGIIERELVEN